MIPNHSKSRPSFLILCSIALVLTTTPRALARLDRPTHAEVIAGDVLQSPSNIEASPLHAAAACGDFAEVARLLEAGADPNARDGMLRTPLHLAAGGDHPSPAVIEVLLKAGADVNAASLFGMTPLHFAVVGNLAPAFMEILLCTKARKVAGRLIDRRTMPETGPYSPSTSSVEFLLRNGADVDARMAGGYSPLHLVCAFGSSLDVVKVLLKTVPRSFPPPAQEPGRRTDTADRIETNDSPPLPDALRGPPVDVNARSLLGFTPLHFAVGGNLAPGFVDVLLKADDDENAKTALLRFALLNIAARGNGRPAFLTFELRSELRPGATGYSDVYESPNGRRWIFVNVLLKADADVNPKPVDREVSQSVASKSSSAAAVVEVLLKAGANLNARSDLEIAPLHLAAGGDHPSPAVVVALLKAGAFVNASCSGLSITPLHLAAAGSRDVTFLKALLKFGANTDAKLVNGRTPLHLASVFGPSSDFVKALLEAGANPRSIDSAGKTPHALAAPEYREILWKAMMDKPLQ